MIRTLTKWHERSLNLFSSRSHYALSINKFQYNNTKSFYNLSFVKDQNARVCLLFRGFCV